MSLRCPSGLRMTAKGSKSSPSRVRTSSPVPSPVARSSTQLAAPSLPARTGSAAGGTTGSASTGPSASATPHISVMNVDRHFERMGGPLGKVVFPE
ncbi:hypothetical protein [Pyxidicoccus xibeiensis]|uniref:hypothetical protein n=1 Tax=Pyxidicoccus xibeiensis TaxID=2906759 RepID=UPI0020A7DDB5|nr:hypothetical protein [Pyxidicoccus xibeiensis]MCP3141540.1 hypothetical protein [Pyxidicoccus xibeiensis]